MPEQSGERILIAVDVALATGDGRPSARRRWVAAMTAAAGRGGAVIRAGWRRCAAVVGPLAVVGVALGWIWSVIAPPERVARTSAGQILPLVDESYHRFDDLAVFLLMGLAAGLVTAVVLWRLPVRRGPGVLLIAAMGSLLAAWLAAGTGVLFAAGHYPVPKAPGVGVPFDQPPRLESWWVLVGQPLAMAATYGALAAWNGRDDLAGDERRT